MTSRRIGSAVIDDVEIPSTSADADVMVYESIDNGYVVDEDGQEIPGEVVNYVEIESDDWMPRLENPETSLSETVNSHRSTSNFNGPGQIQNVQDQNAPALSEWAPAARPTNAPKVGTVAPKQVLLTEDRIKARPRLYVGLGRQSNKTTKELEKQWKDNDLAEERITTESNNQVPGMRSLFKLYGQSVVRGIKPLSSLNDEALEDEEDEIAYYSGVNLSEAEEEEMDANCESLGEQAEIVYDHTEGPSTSMEPASVTYSEIIASRHEKQKKFIYREWPLYWDRVIDFQEACEILCGQNPLDRQMVCTSVPQGYKEEGTFIVDLREFSNRHDVHLDGLGSWGKPAARVRFFLRDPVGKLMKCYDSKGHLVGNRYDFKCMCKRYEHPSTVDRESRFVKKVFTALFPPERNRAVALAIITYEWTGKESFDFPINAVSRSGRQNVIVAPVGGWERASFGTADHGALPPTMSAYFGDMPLYSVGAIDFGMAASIILGGTKVDDNKICHAVPQRYREAGTFVISLHNLNSELDVRRDDNGYWGKPACHSRYYKIDNATGDAIRIDRGYKLPEEGMGYDIQILSKRYCHPAVGGRFIRKIYTPKKNGVDRFNSSQFAVLVYFWKGEPEFFDVERQNQNKVHKRTIQTNAETDENKEEQYGYEYTAAPRKRLRGSQISQIPYMNESQLDALEEDILRQEVKNQERLAGFLDRAQLFLDQMEQRIGSVVDEDFITTDGRRLAVVVNPEQPHQIINPVDHNI